MDVINDVSHRIHVWYIYTNIGGILMVNVTIYGIHGSYGYVPTKNIKPTNIKQRVILGMMVNVYSTHGVYGQDNLLTCRYGRCFLVCFHIYLSCPAPISSAATVPDGLNDDNSPR